jgi:hypothetical protein
MLVVVTDTQIIPASHVCGQCVLASQDGQPRWSQGRPCTGRVVPKRSDRDPDQYECPMGFRIMDID